ncbi:MAG: MEDS domain-containing protein [Vicinamibacterales bacterium]
MSRQHERVARGQVSTEHQVQLFDDVESLTETVTAFLFEGWQRGETLLVIARPENWALVSRRLAADGCPVDEEIASERLVVLDAATTLATFLRNGRPVPERFAQKTGRLVERLSKQSRTRLRVYGEMVDILAAHGEFASVQELERLWNELGCLYSLTLLCGYSSGHFGDARTASVLRDICEGHDKATAKPTDLLGSWLLADRRSRYHTDAP